MNISSEIAKWPTTTNYNVCNDHRKIEHDYRQRPNHGQFLGNKKIPADTALMPEKEGMFGKTRT